VRRLLVAFLVLLAPAAPAAAQGLAMHGEPRYPAGFAHFDYVNPDAPKGGSLRMARTGSFDSLNPFSVIGVPAQGLTLTFQSLLARSADEPFSLYPQIAESVEVTEDRSQVTFRLDPEARFHDGAHVTADDVLFTWEALRRNGRPNHRTYYNQVERAEKLDERRVRFHLGGGNRELPLLLGLMPILSASAMAGREIGRPTLEPIVGTGPYRVAAVDPGRSIAYRRIDGHWSEKLGSARGRHNFDEVRYDYYRDDATRLAAFRAGQYDVREEADPRLWAEAYDFPARREGRVRLEGFPHGRPSGLYGIVLNARRPPFDDPRVRRALALALDFEWLNRTYFHGAYARTASLFGGSDLAADGPADARERALLAPFPDALPAAALAGAFRPGNGEAGVRESLLAARDLLAEAGWRHVDGRLAGPDGRPLRFEIMLVRRDEERVALAWSQALARLGVTADVRNVDTAQYQSRLDAFDYDAIFYNWLVSLSPGNEQAFYWGSAAAGQTGSRNYPGIRSPAIDAAVEALVGAHDRAGLAAAARVLDRVLMWGGWAVPLWHLPEDRLAYWDRFGRPAATPLYGYQLDAWWEDADRTAAIGPRR